MAIPNVATLFQKIASGSEGGNEFARFVKLLLIAEYKNLGEHLHCESDASGDFRKVDAYLEGDKHFPDCITGFQFKFFPSRMSSSQRSEIENSVRDALDENKYMQRFILVTPEDFKKEQQTWFNTLRKKYKKEYWLKSNGIMRNCNFILEHWGHSKIIELALKHDHVGFHYFPELYPVGIGKFKIVKASIDCSICDWMKFEENKFGYYQNYSENKKELTTDPVFDFQFANNSPEIFLLEKIEIHLIKIWTQLKGIPQDQFLKSIGILEHNIDFSKPINEICFLNPLIFDPMKPKRFNLQLNHFTSNCPGNCAELKFWFHFTNYSISTDTFFLSF